LFEEPIEMTALCVTALALIYALIVEISYLRYIKLVTGNKPCYVVPIVKDELPPLEVPLPPTKSITPIKAVPKIEIISYSEEGSVTPNLIKGVKPLPHQDADDEDDEGDDE